MEGENVDDAEAVYDGWAEFYHASLDPDHDDVPFYRDLAREADGPTLEVACGTGRIYLDLLRDGVDVDGIDVSRRVLDVLEREAARDGLDPTVRKADVRTFEADREYGLVVFAFRAFNHLLTLDDQRAALERVRDALAPGGRLALASFVPSVEYVAEHYGEREVQEFAYDGETYRSVMEPTLKDEVEGIARNHRTVLDADGEVAFETEFDLAMVPKRQFELLFELAGYADWQVYGGFDRDPLTDASQEQVWVAER